jgi:hypothetical protein
VREDVLFGNGLGHARHTRLCHGVVQLPGISIHTRRTRDVDDVARLAVLDAEVRRRSAHDLEGRGSVQVDNGMPLLVCHLVDDAVPCVARVVDNDVDLAVAKLRCLLNQGLDVCIVEDVAGDCDGAAAVLLDLVDDGLGLLCAVSDMFVALSRQLEVTYWHLHPQPRPLHPRSQTTSQPRHRFPVPSP